MRKIAFLRKSKKRPPPPPFRAEPPQPPYKNPSAFFLTFRINLFLNKYAISKDLRSNSQPTSNHIPNHKRASKLHAVTKLIRKARIMRVAQGPNLQAHRVDYQICFSDRFSVKNIAHKKRLQKSKPLTPWGVSGWGIMKDQTY